MDGINFLMTKADQVHVSISLYYYMCLFCWQIYLQMVWPRGSTVATGYLCTRNIRKIPDHPLANLNSKPKMMKKLPSWSSDRRRHENCAIFPQPIIVIIAMQMHMHGTHFHCRSWRGSWPPWSLIRSIITHSGGHANKNLMKGAQLQLICFKILTLVNCDPQGDLHFHCKILFNCSQNTISCHCPLKIA